eukprot:TRINITY_DN19661_c0_g2_i1.p1 TRINITY_DN19661_c0_g2~~TRINITY_DN19661_c0_g2_i1.p1  ORF type:complete len:335 (-),score=77.20 TRINITY_DN19661_c0_g2_i1:230-1168(-)
MRRSGRAGGYPAAPADAVTEARQRAQRASLLEAKLEQIDAALAKLRSSAVQTGDGAADAADAAVTDTGAGAAAATAAKSTSLASAHETASPESGKRAALQLEVVIGDSNLARTNPAIVEQICSMVNRAYGYIRVDEDDITERLAMGDPGSFRGNRVLHLAMLGNRPVGCMSSTFRVPWAEEGCGHWGLLVVDEAMQGRGVASAMVKAAEARLATMCEEIQIEYEFTRGDALSERLLKWYEGRLGFRCAHGPPRGRGTEFRKCRKPIPEAAQRRGQTERLQALRADLSAELTKLRSLVAVDDAGAVPVAAAVA